MKGKETTVVGIDWSSNSHTCYALEDEKLFKISDDVAGYKKLINRYEKAVFVIEEANNRIGQYLLKNNKKVYVLSPSRSKQARQYHFSSGAKTDNLDAKAIALTFKEHPGYCFEARYSEDAVTITEMVNAYNVVCNSHAQNCNRLHTALGKYFPEFLRVMKDAYKSVAALIILSEYPTIDELRETTNDELKKLINSKEARFNSSLKKKLDTIRKEADSWNASSYGSRLIKTLVQTLYALRMEKEHLLAEMDRFLKASPYKVVLTVPGIGAVAGAYIVKAFLTHDFKNYQEFQRYVGTIPMIVQSGKKSFMIMRRKCDRDTRDKLYFAALASRSQSSWTKAYYLKKRNEGKTNGHALRALGNILLKISFAVLSKFEEYDEAFFLNAKGIKTHLNHTTNSQSNSNPGDSQDVNPSLAATKDVIDVLTVTGR